MKKESKKKHSQHEIIPEYEEEAEEMIDWLDEQENTPEYKEEEQRRLKKEVKFYLELVDVLNEIKENGYNPKYRKEVEEFYEKQYKTLGWPESRIKPLRNNLHTRLTHQDIYFKYKEMRGKGYLKKPEAIAILCKKYGYKKNTIEKIIYTGSSNK